MMPIRPRLSPAIADVRRAVRDALAGLAQSTGDSRDPTFRPAASPVTGHQADELVLIGLSGGADSLALAAATAFEAPRAGFTAGAVIVDHGLQSGSADVAAQAAAKARALGLAPVIVERVEVDARPTSGGPEAAARTARYRAVAAAAAATGASRVLLGHTLDDQAETVLLGLARGSGPTSLSGMAADTGVYLRPLLGISRAQTEQFCTDSGLEPWSDPHNSDPAFTRVRVRQSVLPVLERELGPGITAALARTAEQLREDSAALDAIAEQVARSSIQRLGEGDRLATVQAAASDDVSDSDEGLDSTSGSGSNDEVGDENTSMRAGPSPATSSGRSPATNGIPRDTVAIEVSVLAGGLPAVRQRVIRFIAESEFGASLSRNQTLAVAALLTDWRGQKELHLPGIRVVRKDGRLIFSAAGDGAT